jgi:hypothetical protein
VALGLLFTTVENDWLHVIIAGQMQTWRWLWLLGVLSVLLAPAIAISCWRTGGVARAAAVLLLAAWLTRVDPLAVVPMALACAAVLVPTVVLNARHKRLIELGAYVLLAASLVQVVQEIRDTLPQLDVIRTRHDPYLVAIGQARLICYDGLLPAALLVLVLWSGDHALLRHSAPLLGAVAALLLISILPNAVRTWTFVRYPVERYQAFAPWRAAIPESAEVLWPDPPTLIWFELGRASYWSLYQMSGMVFSRDVTMISTSRETAVTPLLPQLGRKINGTRYEIPDDSSTDEPRDMSLPCRLPGVIYYASWIDLGPTPYPAVHPDIEKPRATLYLYRCGVNHQ